MGIKMKARNPQLEIRNKLQIKNIPPVFYFEFLKLTFVSCFEFRISNF